MRSRSATTFGRDDELRQLLTLAAKARAGAAMPVLVHGEAGVGKTRLVSDLVTALREHDALVFVGHGVHLAEGEVPFGVLSESLRDLVRSVGADAVRVLLGADAEQLSPLVPALRSGPRIDADRARVISATADLIEALAADRLVCWVVEDLQWADTPTRDVFAYVTRFLTSAALLAVATWRDEDDGPPRPSDLGEAIGLQRLGEDDAGALVADLAPGLDASDRERVLQLSQGLPFMAEELVDSWRPGSGIDPDYLRRLVLTRLPDLSAAARDLVELASVGEGHLDVRLLEDGLGVDPAAIREAATAGILETDPGGRQLRFRHALLREAIVDAVPPGDRRRLHRRWAEALDADDGALTASARVTAQATHWHEAQDPARALPALAEAVRTARRLPAPAMEYASLSRVLEWWDHVADASALTSLTREQVLVDTVSLGMTVSEFDAVAALLDAERVRLRPGDDPVGAAWLELRRAVFDDNFRTTLPDPAWIETLLAAEVDDPRLTDCLTLLVWTGMSSDLTSRVTEVAGQMLARAVDPGARLYAALSVVQLLEGAGEFEQALTRLRAERPALAGGTLDEQWMVAVFEAWLLILLGRAEEAVPLLEHELGRLSRPSTMSGHYASLAENLAHAYIALGRYDDALVLTSEALATVPELAEDDEVLLVGDTLRGHAIDVLVARGDLVEARRTSRLVEAHAGRNPWADRAPSAEIIARLATLSAAEGDLGRCRAELAGAWDLPPSPALSEQLPRAVLTALRAESSLVDRHDPAAAAESAALVDRVLAMAEHLARPGARGRAWWAEVHAHAARSRGGDTAAGWAPAVAGWRECNQPYDVALCLRFLGEAALGEGDSRTAAEALSEAYDICGELGARPLGDAVLAVARRGRLPVGPAGVPPGPGPLTARETEVLGLVAQGRSNQQIATELFMSPKTVSVHVSRILAKLGVANRTEAAATGRRLGLVD